MLVPLLQPKFVVLECANGATVYGCYGLAQARSLQVIADVHMFDIYRPFAPL